MAPSVIIDDAHPRLSFYGIQWALQENADSLFNRTITVCHTEIRNTSRPPTLDISFYGSDIDFYGPVSGDVAMNYTIDGSSKRPAILNTTTSSVKTGVNVWGLSGLDTRRHSIEISPTNGLFSFDYITYTPNKNTPLVGRSLILDDADPSLQYSTNWTKTSGRQLAEAIPYQDTLTGSNKQNSTLKFNFVGAAVSVYGALNQQDGRLSASFSVDGAAATSFTPFNGTQAANTSSWRLNQEFFHEDLAPGNHSLLVTLQEVTGSQMLWIDSVIYEGSSGTDLGFSSSGGGNNTRSSSLHFSNGGIIGVVAAVIILGIICRCLRRKRRYGMCSLGKSKSSESVNNHLPSSSPPPPPIQPAPILFFIPPQQTPPPPMTTMPNAWAANPQPYMPMPTSNIPARTPSQENIVPPAEPTVQPASSSGPSPPSQPSSQTTPNPPRRTVSQDAGPADAPPPYDETLYIP